MLLSTLQLPGKIGKDWIPGRINWICRGWGRQQYFETYLGDLNMQLIVPATALNLEKGEFMAIRKERTK